MNKLVSLHETTVAKMEWFYLTLVNGRLVDDNDDEANPNWPSFETEAEAEVWLDENDIRATVR